MPAQFSDLESHTFPLDQICSYQTKLVNDELKTNKEDISMFQIVYHEHGWGNKGGNF